MLKDLIDKSREPVFFCIGTMKCLGDSVAPRIGCTLKSLGYKVYGTPDDQWHALVLRQKYEEIYLKLDTKVFQPIAIDMCFFDSLDKDLKVKSKACKPGNGVGKSLPEIGELTIYVNSIKAFTKQIKESQSTVNDFTRIYLHFSSHFDEYADMDIFNSVMNSVVEEIVNTYDAKEMFEDIENII